MNELDKAIKRANKMSELHNDEYVVIWESGWSVISVDLYYSSYRERGYDVVYTSIDAELSDNKEQGSIDAGTAIFLFFCALVAVALYLAAPQAVTELLGAIVGLLS